MSEEVTTTKEALEPILCANCGNQVYQSDNKWYHLSTAGMPCNVAAQAIPSRVSAPIAPEVDDEFTDADLTLIEATAEAAGSDEIARLAGYAKRLRGSLPAPAATVAPQQSDDDVRLIADIVEAVNRSKSINEDGEWWLDTLKAKARVRELLAQAKSDDGCKWRVALRMYQKTHDDLVALRQQVEDTIIVARTDVDAEDSITAYHFKTGAIHRLLAEARKGDGPDTPESREVREAAAPASPAAPVLHCSCGAACTPDEYEAHRAMGHDTSVASTSSNAWATWFKKLGDRASAEVVKATADLVTNERLAALVQRGVLPNPAAIRDEAETPYDRGFSDMRERAIQIAESYCEDIPQHVDLENDKNTFAAGYLVAAGSIRQALTRIPFAPTSPSTRIRDAAELIAIDRLGPRSDAPEFWDKYVKRVISIIERCLAGEDQKSTPTGLSGSPR
jgi:hypothetical protein